MKLTFDTLRSHLPAEPARAYLVSGDEALLVGEAADAIRARVRRAGFEEREVHFIERVADWDAVRASSNNLSLFGSRKLIELRLPSGKPGVGGANAIVELLADASPDNVYLMLTGKLEREQNNSAWVKAFDSAGAWLPVWPVELARLPQWLRARAATLELDLDDAAVQIHRRSHRRKPARRAPGTRETQVAGQRPTGRSRRRAGLARRQRALRRVPARRGGAGRRRAARPAHPGGAAQRRRGADAGAVVAVAREIHNAWGTTQNEGYNARSWQRPSAGARNRAAAAPRACLTPGSRRAFRAPIA